MTCKREVFRAYRQTDYDRVAELWTRINRELSPAILHDRVERYIATVLAGELRNAGEIFSPTKRNGLWLTLVDDRIVGTFGIEQQGPDVTELRRMYLDAEFRGRGIALRMLRFAEERARDFGFSRMILSTSEVQKAALRFYDKTGFRMVKVETAEAMSTKTVGGGITRFQFEKTLSFEAAACPRSGARDLIE